MPDLVLEAFGDRFTKNAKITFGSGKEVIKDSEGTRHARSMDALFSISEGDREPKGHSYHFECETWGDKTLLIRIAQYDLGHAFMNVDYSDDGVRIRFPKSAGILLRKDYCGDENKMNIIIEYPGGECRYKIPVIRIKDYSMEELFEKRLLVIIPFYPFKYSEKDLEMMDKDKDRLQDFWNELDKIKERLMKMVRDGELEYWHVLDILQYTVEVYEKMTVKYKNLQEGVEEMRKVKLIVTEVDIIRDELIEKNKLLETANEQLASQSEQLASQNEQLASKDEQIARQEKELEEYRRRFGTLVTV